MKDRWKNNLGLKIIAVLFAVFLWWTVVNVDDPVGVKEFQTDVVVQHAEVITNEGKSYQITNNTKNITVTVKARRKVLSKIKASNIVATADFYELQGTTVPIRVTIKGFEGAYEEVSANPRNLQIRTEVTETKIFPITVSHTGDVREGYVLDKINTVAIPKTIEISGPKSSLGRIAKVVAKVDVSELAKDTTIPAEVIYYDSADNIIDKSLLSSNCDKNGVSIQVKLWRTKNVSVKFDTSLIKPAEGFVFAGITFEPKKILVAGKTEVIDAITELEVKADALKMNGISQNKEIVIDVAPYLPEGIYLVDEAAGGVVVTVSVEKVGVKTLSLPVRSLKVNNASEEFDLSFADSQTVNLEFVGTKDVLDSLTSEKIIAVIDLGQCKEEGTYEVLVQVIDLPEQCVYSGEAKIQITLTKKSMEQ